VGKQPDYDVAYTFEPIDPSAFDAVILPAAMLGVPVSESVWLPMIAYGDHNYLRQAFLAGCFDFLKDPWGPEELLFRLERLFRISHKPLEWQGLSLLGNILTADSGFREVLTHPEAAILKQLLSNQGEVVPREALFYAIWGRLPDNKSRAIDVHISSLRKKITRLLADNESINPITSVRRIGYMVPEVAGS
jgi:DNA-binding response OmpR family regulator